MKRRLKEMEDNFNEKIQGLKNENTEIKGNIIELQKENSEIKNENSEIKGNIIEIQKEN